MSFLEPFAIFPQSSTPLNSIWTTIPSCTMQGKNIGQMKMEMQQKDNNNDDNKMSVTEGCGIPTQP